VQNIVHNSEYITLKQPSDDITKCTSPLTDVQCQEIQEICQDLILSAVDDSTFLSEIIAGDEAWCFLCDSQTKCEPNE
jgi:hypothetical protein